jgi:hypothetical protein
VLQFPGTRDGDIPVKMTETARFALCSINGRYVGIPISLRPKGVPDDERTFDYTGVPQGGCRESAAGNLTRARERSLPFHLSTRVTSVAGAGTFSSSMNLSTWDIS